MKKIKLILFLGLLISCKEEFEIIPDYDSEYYEIESPLITNQNLAEEISIDELKINVEKKYSGYRLYVNEMGKIEKIKIIRGETTEIDKQNISKIQKWSFQSFHIIDKPAKVRFDVVLEESGDGRPIISEPKPNDVYYITADELPLPIGGIVAIQKKVYYPELAKRAGIEGRVFVKAYINEEGNVVKAEVIKSAHEVLDSAALNAVLKTKFKPGIQNGKKIKTQVSIPIVFKLN